ncbi:MULTISPECIES: nucleotide sugar dehydrogenase [Porphyromonadaceae]|uniref:UDP-N-acetyl-D-galactosamine dehydrogenase n=1 Tax=Sanguibacteroides justesenii TaxID=1547597 RepID=A0A0C3RLG6_9PORP|nr:MULTISPECIES: nucleotide sugar dehydrogenase [Porphyromonadaceae]KIO46299.1 UDP-N-acetyl-D-galactosamine dehydrogenase [Sanguibacteroides justesenii]KIO47544.1 UDP-N-acetyl-D-galactosamine dehydrogenase [Sanguibacteroides justesenii]PXZ44359.1 nucleotide sugar dehydrogenase [Sanguibacteroides justesenii]
MYTRLVSKKAKLALVGLGYVGLPIALAFAKKISVVGFDIKEDRLEKMRNRIDPSEELPPEAFDHSDIEFTSSVDQLRAASFFIVAVPTPIDEYNQPDLKPLLAATRTVAKVLKKGDYVVFESTVYPGCTEEDCLPLLEEISGLKVGRDFKIGYSPERINPGDSKHILSNTIKIVSGCDAEALETIAKVYELVVEPGVHPAPCIKVAEAAKIIENTQRDVNIALMNELSIIFSRIGINTFDVLEAAGTKWNFLKFYPGLVGGHCIGVDPYYLVHKAKELKYHPQIINAGRFINDSMGAYIAKKMVKKLIAMGKSVLGARVLVMGVTFKEDVSDIRNSKVADIIRELRDFGVDVDVVDPHADSEAVQEEYGFKLVEKPRDNYDAVVVAVSHKEYEMLDETYFKSLTYENALLVDIKGILREKIHSLKYWSL